MKADFTFMGFPVVMDDQAPPDRCYVLHAPPAETAQWLNELPPAERWKWIAGHSIAILNIGGDVPEC